MSGCEFMSTTLGMMTKARKKKSRNQSSQKIISKTLKFEKLRFRKNLFWKAESPKKYDIQSTNIEKSLIYNISVVI
jgi:hypothetical protein